MYCWSFTVEAVVCADSLEAGGASGDSKEVKTVAVKSEFPSVKSEPTLSPTLPPDTDDNETLPVVSCAPVTADKFEFLDSVAAFHATAVKKSQDRQTLVTNIGPYRRALCARRDLAVRRALCKVDKVPASLCFTVSRHDSIEACVANNFTQ